jgi:serine protease Do
VPAFYNDDFWDTPFEDVYPDHWAYEAINRIKKRRVIGGYPDGTFKPEHFATRAELASAIDKEYTNRFDLIESCRASIVRVEVGRRSTSESPGEKILSIGSGIVLSKDGYIATNVHVVLPGCDGGFVRVVFGNGKSAEAQIPYGDGARDCAILKVDPCPELKFTDISVFKKVGEEVYAIGYPLALPGANSVSKGIVSRIARYKAYDEWVNFVQTDAAINPGNSGGGLFNRYGELIAMPTRKYVKIGNIPVDNIALCLAAEEILHVWSKVKEGKTGMVNAELATMDVEVS